MKRLTGQNPAVADSRSAWTGDRLETLHWLGLSLRVRRDWQIVRHGLNRQRGRMTFIDRTHQRLLVSWARLKKPLDLDRVFEDYRARDRENDEHCQITPLAGPEPWEGYRRSRTDQTITRAGMIDPTREPGLWVEMTFTWPDEIDEALEQVILSSVRVNPEPADDERYRTRAFRLDARVPGKWELTKVEPKPADVTFTYQRGRATLMIQRLGMLESWYDGDAHQWIRKTVPRPIERFDAVRFAGHSATLGDSWEKNRPIGRLLKLVRRRRDVVWQCEQDRALYRLTLFARPRTMAKMNLEDFVVRCCTARGQKP